MTDQVCRIICYMLYATELVLVGEAIFHNAVKEKIRYVVMAAVYVAVIIPTVFFMENHFLVEIGLNMAIYICLFRGRIMQRLARCFGVYIFSSGDSQ